MSRIKEAFISRWGSEGQIVQADFKQLEVIGAAFLSQDPMMYEDILAGIDAHCQSASWMNPHTYEEILAGYEAEDKYFTQMRKKAKKPRFELQYGSYPAGIALSNSIPKAQAQDLFDNYYGRYTVLAAWQEANREEARKNREMRQRTEVDLDTGETNTTLTWFVCKLPSLTGRVYTFREYDTPEFIKERDGIHLQIKDTQVKNYPSQGFATGDVVPMMLGKTYRRLKTGPMAQRALMIGTVHDSILFDVHQTAIDQGFCEGVKKFLEKTPSFIEETWGFVFDLPLLVDVEAGPNWDSMGRVA